MVIKLWFILVFGFILPVEIFKFLEYIYYIDYKFNLKQGCFILANHYSLSIHFINSNGWQQCIIVTSTSFKSNTFYVDCKNREFGIK